MAVLSASQEIVSRTSAPLLLSIGGFFILVTGLHCVWLNNYRLRSRKVMSQLDGLGFMPKERYEGLRVTGALVISVQTFHTALVVLICVALRLAFVQQGLS